MTLTATDCLRRGFANLAANWELAALYLLQSVATTILVFAGLVAPAAMLGLHVLISSWDTARATEEFEEALGAILLRVTDNVPLLVLSALAMLAVWTVAFLVYSYFQAGIYGVLTEADRRVPAGVYARPAFRAFSLSSFHGWARRYLWRFFWFLNLTGLFAGGLALAATLATVVLVWSADGGAVLPIYAAGCLGAILFFVATLALILWFLVAQADLAQEESGPWQACRRGFAVLSDRPGAVLLLVLAFIAAGAVISALFAPFFFGTVLGMGDPFSVLVLQVLLSLLQVIPTAPLAVALAGALVALVRSETQSEPEVLAA